MSFEDSDTAGRFRIRYLFFVDTQQSEKSTSITREPLQSNNNFPKGLRGGGACFDWSVQDIVYFDSTQIFFVLVWLVCAAAVPSRKSPASNVARSAELTAGRICHKDRRHRTSFFVYYDFLLVYVSLGNRSRIRLK